MISCTDHKKKKNTGILHGPPIRSWQLFMHNCSATVTVVTLWPYVSVEKQLIIHDFLYWFKKNQKYSINVLITNPSITTIYAWSLCNRYWCHIMTLCLCRRAAHYTWFPVLISKKRKKNYRNIVLTTNPKMATIYAWSPWDRYFVYCTHKNMPKNCNDRARLLLMQVYRISNDWPLSLPASERNWYCSNLSIVQWLKSWSIRVFIEVL